MLGGGHYFTFGGGVDGGKILGEYPPDITTNGPLNIGRGRIIPTSGWEPQPLLFQIVALVAISIGILTVALLELCLASFVFIYQ